MSAINEINKIEKSLTSATNNIVSGPPVVRVELSLDCGVEVESESVECKEKMGKLRELLERYLS